MASTALRLLALALASMVGCAGSSASYTRLRRQAERGRVVAAEEVRASELIGYHAQSDAPRLPPLPQGARSGIGLEAVLGNPALPLGPARPVLQVSLRGTAGTRRPPANVVLVVDLSGSMRDGDKIGAARHGVARFVEALDPLDRVSLVTFGDRASGLGPVLLGESRQALLRAVGRWEPGGGTNLHAALELALGHALRGRGPEGASRVVLLTDGMPTAGVTDPRRILALAERFRQGGISVTTVGLGEEIDDGLLAGIARATGGQYRYLDGPAEVERVFGAEARGLTEAAAREVDLSIALPPGWSVARSFDERVLCPVPSTCAARLGDVAGDEAVVVLLELDAPPPTRDERVVVEVTFLAPDATAARASGRAVVEVSRVPQLAYDPAPGGTTLRNLALGRAALALREADLLRRRGEPEAGASLLAATVASMREARARLAEAGASGLAASLGEPESLVDRTRRALEAEAPTRAAGPAPGSAAWSGWGW